MFVLEHVSNCLLHTNPSRRQRSKQCINREMDSEAKLSRQILVIDLMKDLNVAFFIETSTSIRAGVVYAFQPAMLIVPMTLPHHRNYNLYSVGEAVTSMLLCYHAGLKKEPFVRSGSCITIIRNWQAKIERELK